jgi:hypothetical protein
MGGPYNINDKVDASQLDTAATANSVAQRTSDGSLNVNALGAAGNITLSGNQPQLRFSELDTTDQNFGFRLNSGVMIFEQRNNNFSVTTERMRIDSSGRVGIGTSTPRAGIKLDVASTGEAVIGVTDLDQANTWGNFSHNNGLTQFVSRNGDSFGSFVWYGADGSTFPERMRIDSSGKVGIGVSSTPINASLQIGKGITSGPPAAGANTAAACFGNDTSQNAYGLVMGADGFGKGYISAQRTDGTATTYSLLLQPNGGNTGIGTINPGAPLEVRRDGTGQTVIARFSNHNTDVHFLNLKVDDASNLVIYDSTGYSSGGHVFQAGGAERMRITSSGNMGIGTSSPAEKLDVVGTIRYSGAVESGALGSRLWIPGQAIGSSTYAGLYGPALTYLAKYDGGWKSIGGGTASAITIDEGRFAFSSSQAVGSADSALTWTNRLVIDGNGNVGIGTSSPSAKLDLLTSGGFCVVKTGNGTTNMNVGVSSDNSTFIEVPQAQPIRFITNDTERMRIDSSGNVGIGTSDPGAYRLYVSGDQYISGTLTEASSEALKENIDPITNALGIVSKLTGVTYDRKDGTAKNRAGLIAEDVEKILPNVVQKDETGNPSGIKYTNLIAYLIESIKELKAEIDVLKGK